MSNKWFCKEIEWHCARENNEVCPFSHVRCQKINRAECGICSVAHSGAMQIICPCLLSSCEFIDFIALNILNCSSVSCFKEVKVGSNFLDYLLVDKNDKTNYCGVELQALDTTGNYRWVFGEKVKPFCINWKTTKKTIVSQIISKERIFNKFQKPLVLVMQDSLFEYIGFKKAKFNKTKSIHVLPVHYEKGEFKLLEINSYKVGDFVNLMTADENIDLDSIIDRLVEKI